MLPNEAPHREGEEDEVVYYCHRNASETLRTLLKRRQAPVNSQEDFALFFGIVQPGGPDTAATAHNDVPQQQGKKEDAVLDVLPKPVRRQSSDDVDVCTTPEMAPARRSRTPNRDLHRAEQYFDCFARNSCDSSHTNASAQVPRTKVTEQNNAIIEQRLASRGTATQGLLADKLPPSAVFTSGSKRTLEDLADEEGDRNTSLGKRAHVSAPLVPTTAHPIVTRIVERLATDSLQWHNRGAPAAITLTALSTVFWGGITVLRGKTRCLADAIAGIAADDIVDVVLRTTVFHEGATALDACVDVGLPLIMLPGVGGAVRTLLCGNTVKFCSASPLGGGGGSSTASFRYPTVGEEQPRPCVEPATGGFAAGPGPEWFVPFAVLQQFMTEAEQ